MPPDGKIPRPAALHLLKRTPLQTVENHLNWLATEMQTSPQDLMAEGVFESLAQWAHEETDLARRTDPEANIGISTLSSYIKYDQHAGSVIETLLTNRRKSREQALQQSPIPRKVALG